MVGKKNSTAIVWPVSWITYRYSSYSHQNDLIKQATIEFNEGYDAPVCIYCGSDTIIGHGTRKTKIGNKTRMLCGHCNKTFTLENEVGFENMQVTAKMVTVFHQSLQSLFLYRTSNIDLPKSHPDIWINLIINREIWINLITISGG